MQIDTGSTDLWIYQPGHTFNLTNSTDVLAQEGYGEGGVIGHVVFADLELGSYSVANQGRFLLSVL